MYTKTMTFKIIHETSYLFSEEVFLEPHLLRFRPKQTPFLSLNSFAISLSGEPAGISTMEDAEQNIIDFCWFEALTNNLTIHAQSDITTTAFNPFNFIIYPESYNTIPFTYDEQTSRVLNAYLQTTALESELIEYTNTAVDKAKHNTISVVTQLTNQIHKDFVVHYRASGAPLSPQNTFALKRGSCRDLSWMQINMFRHLGIAARFVSGYFYFEMDKPMYELHAWVEVFIPGIGWLGCDPSHGILTGSTHFPLASSALAENTMPVSGGLRGSATSKLITNLTIQRTA